MIARRLLLLCVAVLAAALATGCSTVPEIAVPEKVLVQVPVPCVHPDSRPQRPATRTEDDLLNMDTYGRTLATWSDLARLRAYAGELEAVVEGCSRLK